MIKNQRQYKITNKWLRDFTKALKEVSNKEPDVDPLLIQVEVNAIKSQIKEFKKDIKEYNRLKIRHTTPIKSVYDLGNALVKARIMNHLTQKQLGVMIGVKEQQVQRYEETDYQNAALHTILEIAKLLKVTSSSFSISIKKKNNS
jgi:DNA-binding XRE family transcriptional regulator